MSHFHSPFQQNDSFQLTQMTSAESATIISCTKSCDINTKSITPYQFTDHPDTITWNEQYYVYVERVGEFSETAGACWAQVYSNLDAIKSQVEVQKFCSFYRYDTKPKQYRAGVMVSAPPSTLPADFHCIKYPGGTYARFILTGDFSNLPVVCGRVDERVKELNLVKRDDWQIEYYKTDAKTTKPEENIIEILVPIIESESSYHLTDIPDTVEWKSQHYVYVERQGPFKETAPACWKQLHSHLAEIKSQVTVDKYCSLYRYNCMEPSIYRAGITVSSPPTTLPPSYHSITFPGGMYARFRMTGDYSNLPEACGRVEQRVAELKLNVRKDWYIENYITDPNTTKADENVTEILVPIELKQTYQFTENPDTVEWKSQYYVYVERQGPFLETAGPCWKQLYSHIAEIKSQVTVEKYCSIYREDIEPPILRAGATVSSPPATLPASFHCIELSNGMYSRFIMTGDLLHLPSVCQRVKERVAELHLNVRKEDWWIEYFVTDYATTKSEENVTEILVPITNK